MAPHTTNMAVERTQQLSTTDEQNQPVSSQCPECSGCILTHGDETVCEDCGLIIDDQQIDHGPEWRHFDSDTRQRTGGPLTVTRHDRGLSTNIGYGRDANGNTLSTRKQRRLTRMRREQTRARWQSTADKNLSHGLGETQRLASALDLSNALRDQACQLFRSAQNEELLHGRAIESIAAASIYAVCRCNQHPLIIEDVVTIARNGRSRILNAYSTLNRELELPIPPTHPQTYIPRLISQLDLSNDIQQKATEIATKEESTLYLRGCNPVGIAAACIYIAAHTKGNPITQVTVAKVANVSASTVRNRLTDIQPID